MSDSCLTRLHHFQRAGRLHAVRSALSRARCAAPPLSWLIPPHSAVAPFLCWQEGIALPQEAAVRALRTYIDSAGDSGGGMAEGQDSYANAGRQLDAATPLLLHVCG